MYKNIEKEKALSLKDLVDYSEGQVVSKTLVQNELVSMTVFSFAGRNMFCPKGRHLLCRREYRTQCSGLKDSKCSLPYRFKKSVI